MKSALAAFGMASLVGPAISVLLWAPGWFERATSVRADRFVDHLVSYVWFGRILIVYGAEPWSALALSVGFNAAIYLLWGVLVGAVSRWRWARHLSYAGLCAMVIAWSSFLAGFSLAYLDWPVLLVAAAICALPFMWSRRRSPSPQAAS